MTIFSYGMYKLNGTALMKVDPFIAIDFITNPTHRRHALTLMHLSYKNPAQMPIDITRSIASEWLGGTRRRRRKRISGRRIKKRTKRHRHHRW